MFIRRKRRGERTYLQIVENFRDDDGKSHQRILCNLGRQDVLVATGKLDGLIRSGAQYCRTVTLLDARRTAGMGVTTRRIGPALVFERLWWELGIPEVLAGELMERKFGFAVERAVFVTVLHRLFNPGSDRAAEQWKEEYRIEGAEELGLQHFYRAMGWLGEPQSGEPEENARRFVKDRIEEALFQKRRDLYTDMDLVFFDTTSIYFEGAGGETIGQNGHSKDHRPDLKQMVVGVVLDGAGRPVCSQMWPGNMTDVTTLVPVVDRLKTRFGIKRACVVADRGMISQATIKALEEAKIGYILGVRMRKQTEVREEVLGRGGRYEVVHPERVDAKDPSPLEVKEVWVDKKRYIVCRNAEQARKDVADRETIVAALRDKLKQGAKSLVGNKGFRRYLKTQGASFAVDEDKIEAEARFDGRWVLLTDRDFSAADTALKYKQLWMVEDIFRTMKSVLETRPIYHKCDDTIRGHVFCSFLALVLRKALEDRLEDKEKTGIEWARVVRDLDNLSIAEVALDGKRYALRTECQGVAGKVIQAVGVALPPVLAELEV
jgi:transposase